MIHMKRLNEIVRLRGWGNTVSQRLIIFSDFVTLTYMHQVFLILFIPSGEPLKHRLIAFTHTNKERLSWIAAGASAPQSHPPPSKNTSTAIIDTTAPRTAGSLRGQNARLHTWRFPLGPTSAERPPALSAARSGAANWPRIWAAGAAVAEGLRQSWLSDAPALLGREQRCCHFSWWRGADRGLTPARQPSWHDRMRPGSSSLLWEEKPPSAVTLKTTQTPKLVMQAGK